MRCSIEQVLRFNTELKADTYRDNEPMGECLTQR